MEIELEMVTLYDEALVLEYEEDDKTFFGETTGLIELPSE